MKEPLVSIIMPAYNAEKYINQAIKSVEKQTYKNWELLICDDYSSDSTISLIQKHTDKRIKLFCHKYNKGVSEARNTALSNARGNYIAFLDSDDIWHGDKLSIQIDFMQSNCVEFSCTSYGIIKKEVVTDKVFNAKKVLRYKDYLKNTCIGNSTVIIKSDICSAFRIQDGPLEDVVTWMMLLKNGKDCCGLKKRLSFYRVSSNSVSSNKLDNAKKYFFVLRNKQNINFIKSMYYEGWYMLNATLKRLK